MTTSAVFTPLPESEIDAALSGAAAEQHDIAQVQSKNLRLLQAVMRANLKGGLKNLLWLLCMHYNDSKDCAWPSIERLAMLSLTEARTVQRNLKQLVKAGLVVVGRVPGIRSNAFFIVEEAVQAIAIEGISFAKNQPAPVATKGDIYTPKGDIYTPKGDIFPPKGDASVTLTEGTDVGTEDGNGGGTDARATPPAPPVAPAPATPAGPEPTSPALFASQPQKPEQPTAVYSETATDATAFAHLVDRINAQRATNGKPTYALADLHQLRTEAAKAGITAKQAAEWILERTSRNFFHAEFLARPASAPVAPTAPQPAPQPAPAPALTAEEQAEQEAAAAAARAKLKSMFAQPVSAPAPAATATTADTLVVQKTGYKWADDIIAAALAGQQVNMNPLEAACRFANVSYSDMRAAQKRAATALAAVAA